MAFWNRSPWEKEFRTHTKAIRGWLAQLADLGLDIVDLEQQMPEIASGSILTDVESQCDGLATEMNLGAPFLKKLAGIWGGALSTEQFLNHVSALGAATKEQGDAQDKLLSSIDERQIKSLWINEKVRVMSNRDIERMFGILDTRQAAVRWAVVRLYLDHYLRGNSRGDLIVRRVRTGAQELMRSSQARVTFLEH
jgi:hypothetical protein